MLTSQRKTVRVLYASQYASHCLRPMHFPAGPYASRTRPGVCVPYASRVPCTRPVHVPYASCVRVPVCAPIRNTLKAAAAAPKPPEVATRYAAMTESNLDNFTNEAEQVLASWWRQDSGAFGGREDQGSTQEKKRGPPTDSEGRKRPMPPTQVLRHWCRLKKGGRRCQQQVGAGAGLGDFAA